MNLNYFSNRVLKIVLTLTAVGLFSFNSFAISHFSNETYTSIAASGASGAELTDVTITNDGRFVAFATRRTFLTIPADTNGLPDIYVKDRQNGIYYLASVDNNNSQFPNCSAGSPSLAIDGSKLKVVFECKRPQSGTPDIVDVYMRELTITNLGLTTPTATIIINCVGVISVCTDGTGTSIPGGGANINGLSNTAYPQISEDGKYVVFESSRNLSSEILDNNTKDVFRKDLSPSSSGLIQLVSSATPSLNSYRASISSQGRFIVFQTYISQNSNAADSTQQIYRVDMNDSNRVPLLVSSKDGLPDAGDKGSGVFNTSNSIDLRYVADVSQDGRWVVFRSSATNLIPNTPIMRDTAVYLRDTVNNRTYFIGGTGNIQLYPSISNDGRFVNFLSDTTNRIYDRELGILRPTHYLNATGSNSGADYTSQISGNGRFLAINTAALLDYLPQPLGQDIYVYSFSQLNGGDFNADRATDLAFFRPTGGGWFRSLSPNFTSQTPVAYGNQSDTPVSGDFDNDGKTDIAVFRPSNGVWYVIKSSDGSEIQQPFGQNGDIPVAADYDGDGKTDFAVFRPSNGSWYLLRSKSGSSYALQFGANGDKPVLGDYDNDGRADVAVWRPSSAVWYVYRACKIDNTCLNIPSISNGIPMNGNFIAIGFGLSTDKIAQADYDGDGQTDIGVFRPSNGTWYWKKINSAGLNAAQFGLSTDTPVPGDYDGDGITDLAIFRPNLPVFPNTESDGTWYIRKSSDVNITNSIYTKTFGISTDKLIPAAALPQ
jgi:hypothetical protein